MAKTVKVKIKLIIPGGSAAPGAKISQALGPHLNMMEFCKDFNAKTASKKGETCQVLVTAYTDRTFDYIIKTPPTTELIMKKANVAKGSSRPNENKVGTISSKDVEEIAKIKIPDLNAANIEQANKIIAGSARSMGIDVVD